MAKKILIIDENEDFVAITKPAMSNGQYEVEVTISGEGGREKSDRKKNDVTLLDIMMPDPDRYKNCTGVLCDEHSSCAPVILLTGYNTDPVSGKKQDESAILPEKFEGLMRSLGDLSDIFSNTIRKQILKSAKNEHIELKDDPLMKQTNNKRLLDLQNDIPSSADFEKFSHTSTLDDGSTLVFRPIKSTDDVLLRDLFQAVSEDSIAFCKFQPIKAFPHLILEELQKIDCFKNVAIGAFLQEDNEEKIIGTSCYTLNKTANSAEVSFIVRDEWHGKGVSLYLLEIITEIAKKWGIAEFNAVIHKNRTLVLPLFYNSGYNVVIKKESNVYTISYQIGTKLSVRRYMNDNNKICYKVGIK